MRTHVLYALILTCAAPLCAANNSNKVARDWVDCRKVFYVDVNHDGDEKGTAEAPFHTITAALKAVDAHARANPDFLKPGEAPSREEEGRSSAPPHPAYGIEVADGLYTPDTEDFGAEGLKIEHHVLIRGGHPGVTKADADRAWLPAMTPLTKHGRPNATEAIYETTGRGSVIDLKSRSRAFHAVGDAMFRLYGFTVRNGRSEGPGGAVCLQSRKQSDEQELLRSLIRDCTFEHNRAKHGGAVYANPRANLYIVRSTFHYNKAEGKGEAMFSESPHMRRKAVFHAQMYGNEAPHGSAVYGIAGIQHSVIYGNRGGFALELSRGACNICTVAHNDGGGVRLIPAAEGNHGHIGLYCSIIAFNKGVGLRADPDGASIGYRWCDLYGNSQGDRENVPYQHLNYSRPPKFVDGENPDLARRDYSLRADSPCIKAGVTAYGGGFNLDIGGVQRLDAHGMDIGAYRYQPKNFGDKPRPAERFLNETVTLHVDVNWEGEGKGTADAPFKSLTRAMEEYSHLRNRYCYEFYMDNGKLGPFFVIKMADGVYDRSVEEFGPSGMIDAAGGMLRIEGSYVGWEEGDGFDWSPTNRGRRTTILDPEGKSRVFIGKGFPEYRQIHFDNIEFRNGRAPIGGAIYFGGESKTLILTDCLFRNNEATAGAGGAVYNDSYGFPHRTYPFTRNAVIDCQFINNRADQGGGGMAANLASKVGPGHDYVIRNTTFRGNRAGKSGGGLWLRKPCARELMKAHVINTRFVDNEAGESGGGLFTRGHADVRRCLFADNRAPRGGAIGGHGSTMDKWGNSRSAEWADAPLAVRDSLIVRNEGDSAIEYGIAKRGPHFKHDPNAPGLALHRCTVADNAGGTSTSLRAGIHYVAGKDPKSSAGLLVADCVIAGNGETGIAFHAGKSERAATIVRSNVSGHETNYQNAEPGEGSGSEKVAFVNNTAEQVLQRDYRLKESQDHGAAAQTVMAQAGYHDVPAPERLAQRLQAVTAVKGPARAAALAAAVAQIQYPAMLPSHFDWPPVLSETDRLKHLRTLLDACDNAEEQAIVLATLANVRCKNAVKALDLRSIEALRMVGPYLEKSETRPAAASLVVKILEHHRGVFETHRTEAVEACESILKGLTAAEMVAFAETQARRAMTLRQEEDLRIREYAANYLPPDLRLACFNQQWKKAGSDAERELLLSQTISRRGRMSELGRIYTAAALARAVELAKGPLADAPGLKSAALQAAADIALRLRPRNLASQGAAKAAALLKEALALTDSEGVRAAMEERIAFFEDVPQTTVPRVKSAPKIDGKLDDAAWKSAAWIKQLQIATEDCPGTRGGTQVHLAYDDESLYVAFRCDEPNGEQILTRSTCHDMPEVTRDDSVDVLIDCAPAGHYERVERRFLAHTEFHARPAWTPGAYYCITANSRGTVQDLRSDWDGHIDNSVFLGGKEEDYTWQSHAKVKAGKDDKGWTVEMAVPWASLNREAPKAGERIGLNVCRNRTLPDAAGSAHGVATPLRRWGTHERIRRFHDRRWLGWSQHWFHHTVPPPHELTQWSVTGEDSMNWRHSLAAPRFGVAAFE
jgi:hypothetical protein